MPDTSSAIPSEGKRAPAFTLPNESGEKMRLSDHKGAGPWSISTRRTAPRAAR